MRHVSDTAPNWLPTVANLSLLDSDVLTATIPRPARLCYELFCDVERTPEWLTVVRSATVQVRTPGGRAERVAFLALLERATIGYTLDYVYRERDFYVRWQTAEESNIQIGGFAQFVGLGERAVLMHYQLRLDTGGLPPWGDTFYDGHAASSVMNDFRDFVLRNL